MGSMIKNWKTKYIEDGPKRVNKLHLQCGFKITQINADSEFKPLYTEVDNLVIELNCMYKKEHVT